MVAEYTTKVTGEDLYNLLGKTAIDDNTLFVYVDGEDENLGDAAFGKADMVKKNDETIGRTGNGVLTQVFLDTQDDEITVAIINTYLAKPPRTTTRRTTTWTWMSTMWTTTAPAASPST